MELGEENFVIRYYNAREGGGGLDCLPEAGFSFQFSDSGGNAPPRSTRG